MSTPDRMRRAEREITAAAHLDAILDEAPFLSLALKDQDAPYVVPLCFGRDGRTLYVHSAHAGKKMDLLRREPQVGFSAVAGMTVVPAATACAWECHARSVVGTARVRIVEDPEERRRGLDAIMRHYAGGNNQGAAAYTEGSLARTCVVALSVQTLRGKDTGAARTSPGRRRGGGLS